MGGGIRPAPSSAETATPPPSVAQCTPGAHAPGPVTSTSCEWPAIAISRAPAFHGAVFGIVQSAEYGTVLSASW